MSPESYDGNLESPVLRHGAGLTVHTLLCCPRVLGAWATVLPSSDAEREVCVVSRGSWWAATLSRQAATFLQACRGMSVGEWSGSLWPAGSAASLASGSLPWVAGTASSC